MHDDDFDRRLADRLRAYESRLPDAPSPDPSRNRAGVRWPAVVTGGLAVAAGVLLAVLLLNRPDAPIGESSPSSSPSGSAPTVSAEPSASASASASTAPSATSEPTPSAALSGLELTEIASFPGDGGPSMVEELVLTNSGLVAIGISYRADLPNVGPTPLHRARVWTSSDGRSWTETALGDAFENVWLAHLVVRADGSLLALGNRGNPTDGRIDESDPAAWTSADGVTWTDADSGLPETPIDVVQGDRGYLALLAPRIGQERQELWHSADGIEWQVVRELEPGMVEIGAGGEGFVAAGHAIGAGSEGQSFAIASSDGIEWHVALNPPAHAAAVGPVGPDWIAVTAFSSDVPAGTVWASANGLEWAEHGQVPLVQGAPDGSPCGEYPGELSVAGGWLILDGELAYPCSEGGFAVHGTQWISPDGATWTQLPLAAGTPGESRTGAALRDAAELNGDLVLVGEQDGQATFWLAENP